MKVSGFKAAAVAALLLSACASAQASPVSYDFTMHITSTNIAGLKTDGSTDGSLIFTLSAPPAAYYSNAENLLTYFDVSLDGFAFTSFDDCGAHPAGCVSDLQFSAANTLRDLTYFGLADGSAPGNQISLQTSADRFSHFYIQNTGGYADGTFVFLNNNAPAGTLGDPPTPAPEPSSLSLAAAGLAILAGAGLRRRRARRIAG
jgi:MYXO-CTERM domain-containing protein